MTSRVRVSAHSRPSPPLYLHFNRPSGFWPCVKSCLVGGSDKYYRFLAFWLGRLAFVPDGWSKSMADSRPKGLQLRLGHLRVGELHPLSPMYCTRPCCLVQDITRHTCLDPNLDSWNCLSHQTHIALSGSMSSTDQQGSSLGLFSTFPSPLSPL